MLPAMSLERPARFAVEGGYFQGTNSEATREGASRYCCGQQGVLQLPQSVISSIGILRMLDCKELGRNVRFSPGFAGVISRPLALASINSDQPSRKNQLSRDAKPSASQSTCENFRTDSLHVMCDGPRVGNREESNVPADDLLGRKRSPGPNGNPRGTRLPLPTG